MMMRLSFLALALLLPSSLANNERDVCVADSIYHCDNPSRIMNDPTVYCDWDTCRWSLNSFDPDAKPEPCQAIAIIDTSAVPDYLEPCLLWEMMYGEWSTGAPTTPSSPEPSQQPSPPPTQLPSSVPSPSPSHFEHTNIFFNDTLNNETTTNGTMNATGNFSASDHSEGILIISNSTLASENDTKQENSTNSTQLVNDVGFFTGNEGPFAVDFETILLTYVIGDPRKYANRRTLLRGRRRRHLATSDYPATKLDRADMLVLTSEHILTELKRMAVNESDISDVRLVITNVQTGSTTKTTGFHHLQNKTTLLTISQAIDGKVIFSPDFVKRNGGVMSNAHVNYMVKRAFQGEALQRYELLLQMAADDATVRSIQSIHVGLPSDLNFNDGNGIPNISPTQPDGQQESDAAFTWNVYWIAIVAGGGAGILGLICGGLCVCRRSMIVNRSLRKQQQGFGALQSKSSTTLNNSGSGGSSPRNDATESPTSTGHKNQDNNILPQNKDDLDSDSDLDDESRAGRYPQSDMTSVYSYLEGNTLDVDETYSIGQSMMYGNAAPGDDQSQSLWTATDGFMPDNYDAKKHSSTPITPNDNKDDGAKPSAMIILTPTTDEDDDVSMVSDCNQFYGASVEPEAKDDNGNKEDNEDQEENVNEGSTALFEKINNSVSLNGARDDSTEVSDMEGHVGQQRLNLSRFAESSTAAEVSTSSSDSDSRKSNKENPGDSSVSDDDTSCSSLFLGPKAYVNQKQLASVLSISSDNKINTSSTVRTTQQRAPDKTLSDKEKKHLGMSVRNRAKKFENTSFALPPSYR